MKPSTKKKAEQLGMNHATAQAKVTRDMLFHLAVAAGYTCFHCGGTLVRETFSIEHKIPWMDSENPVELFFDLNNIAFSHLPCNSRASRKKKLYDSDTERFAAKNKRRYTPEWRRERYLKTGQ